MDGALWQSLSAVVPKKVDCMLVTCETSHASKFWLKAFITWGAWVKVPPKSVTLEVSHAFKYWLKEDAPAKVWYNVVTCATSQPEMSSLKLEHAVLQ